MNNVLWFIVYFLAINFIAALPIFIVGKFSKIETSNNNFFKDKFYYVLRKLVHQRFTDDFFRINFEILILAFVFLITASFINFTLFFNIALTTTVVIAFIYQFYINVIVKIFKKIPVLVSDINFAKTGLMVFRKKLPVVIIASVIAIITLTFIASFLVSNLMAYGQKISGFSLVYVAFLLVILFATYSLYIIDYNRYNGAVFPSIIHHFYINIKRSQRLKNSLKTLNKTFPYKYANNIRLKKKPNIIFIFLESYGSFALTHKTKSNALKNTMSVLEHNLKSQNFYIASALSESPIASGGSWLCHSSIFFGAKVKDTAAHELIFGQRDYASQLASLPKFLNENGYHSIITSTLSHKNADVDWEKLKNAYPFKDIMLIDKFKYQGKKINAIGDRDTIPDEYTLNFAYNTIKNEQPFMLCLNTMNSHAEFFSPKKAMPNWKDYNLKDFEITDGSKKNRLKNYFTSINYHFDYLNHFFSNNKLDDTIMVMVGDHQPPFITPTNIGKETPIHVISKNEAFINAFKTFNYNLGMFPKNETNQKHESFFSKFLFALNKAYGDSNSDEQTELPIFEDGINLY